MLRGQDAPSCPHFRAAARHAVRGTGFEPVDHAKTVRLAALAGCDFPAPARFARGNSIGAERESAASLLYRTPCEMLRGQDSVLARTFVPRGTQCEGQDLNPWTSTGAELESAAVSRLGYPRTRCAVGTVRAKVLRILLPSVGVANRESSVRVLL